MGSLLRLCSTLLTVALLASACGGGDDDAEPIASTSLATRATTTVAPATTTSAAVSPTTTAGVPVIPQIPMAVIGVESDDVLNVRTGPGVSNDIVGAIEPFSMHVNRYPGEEEPVGSSIWVLVGNAASRDFDAWVNSHFLTEIEGDAAQPASLYQAASDVRDALSRTSPGARLADVVASMGVASVVVSADGFFDADDQSLSAADLASTEGTVRTWGFLDGSGDPIEASVADFLDDLGQSPALQATERVAVNLRLKFGNTIDNALEFFPGATVVEIHYGGDEGDADFTWQTVRLVFLPAENEYQLVGIARDTWTI